MALNDQALQTAITVVPLVGFAIQRALQAFDSIGWALAKIIEKGIQAVAKQEGWPVPDFDMIKGFVMTIASLLLGYLAATNLQDTLRNILPIPNQSGNAAIWLFALIFSAGTEGANSVQKALQNVKDNTKNANTALVVANPSTAKVAPSTSLQLVVPDASKVLFEVLESNGGSVDAKGLYTAPAGPGIYHVVVKLKADPSVVGLVTIMV